MPSSPQDFRAGERVIYVPGVANGDASHEACERGIVSSSNDVNVFVRYFNKRGELAILPQATRPEDLVHTEVRVRCGFCGMNIYGADEGPPCQTQAEAERCDVYRSTP